MPSQAKFLPIFNELDSEAEFGPFRGALPSKAGCCPFPQEAVAPSKLNSAQPPKISTQISSNTMIYNQLKRTIKVTHIWVLSCFMEALKFSQVNYMVQSSKKELCTAIVSFGYPKAYSFYIVIVVGFLLVQFNAIREGYRIQSRPLLCIHFS